MFGHRKNKPLVGKIPSSISMIAHGENLDIANTIINAESNLKTQKTKKRKATRVNAIRRSASIERIFEKKKNSNEKSSIEVLQNKLNELKLREQELSKTEIVSDIPLNLESAAESYDTSSKSSQFIEPKKNLDVPTKPASKLHPTDSNRECLKGNSNLSSSETNKNQFLEQVDIFSAMAKRRSQLKYDDDSEDESISQSETEF